VTVHAFHTTPIGRLLLVGERDRAGGIRLAGIYMEQHRHGPEVDPSWAKDAAAFGEVARQLDEYFDGSRTTFDLPLAPAGTPFQRRVWDELARIPRGTTVTYGELAARVGHPGASRAVGAAVGRNPISIVVPCHRVVGADATLTGYAGGVERKASLLALEGARATSEAAIAASTPPLRAAGGRRAGAASATSAATSTIWRASRRHGPQAAR
jgi:methylated-DNA-[protein]-cysteine S-methyltransferase